MYVEFPKVPYDIGEEVIVFMHGKDEVSNYGTVIDGRCEAVDKNTFSIQLLIEFNNRERLWVDMNLVEKVIPPDVDE